MYEIASPNQRQNENSKLSSTTCQVFEHELFYTSHGIERFSLQSEIGKPILRVKCDYENSHMCLQQLSHTLTDTSSSIENMFTCKPKGKESGSLPQTSVPFV